jgi:hypothetical protein
VRSFLINCFTVFIIDLDEKYAERCAWPRCFADIGAPYSDCSICRSVSFHLPCFERLPDRYDTVLGEPFGTGSAHIMMLGSIRVTRSRDELAASHLDTNHTSAKRRYESLNCEHGDFNAACRAQK